MYDWVDKLTALLVADPRWKEARAKDESWRHRDPALFNPATMIPYELAEHGVSEEALAAAEATLGIALPPSYRAFLSRWDGSHPKARGHRFLSLAEVLTLARGEAAFRRYSGAPEPTAHDGEYYAYKPAHWLFVYAHALGSDGACLDLRGEAPEPAVHTYDPEFIEWDDGEYTLSEYARGSHPAFGSLVAEHVYDAFQWDKVTPDTQAAAKAALNAVRDAHGWPKPRR